MALLQLPDIRQSADFDCGETALRVVLAYHRVVVPPGRVSSPTDGVDPIGLERAARRLHLRVTSGEMDLGDVKHFCDRMRPVMALVHWPGAADSHWVVARGVSRGAVWFHDPETGPGRCSPAEFELAWSASDGRLPTAFRRWGICAWPAV